MTLSQFRLALAWILAGTPGCLGATEPSEPPVQPDDRRPPIALDAAPAPDCVIPSPAAGYVPCPTSPTFPEPSLSCNYTPAHPQALGVLVCQAVTVCDAGPGCDAGLDWGPTQLCDATDGGASCPARNDAGPCEEGGVLLGELCIAPCALTDGGCP